MQEPKLESHCNSLIKIIDNGDLFASHLQTLVNPINCSGTMGKGLAPLFKQRYPLMFKDYQNRCKQGLVKLGEPYVWKDKEPSPILILNFPTKDHWRNKSRLEYISQGLEHLATHAEEWGIRSLAIPALGCGLGGLDWDLVLAEITSHLSPLQIPIQVYKAGPILQKTSKKKKASPSNPKHSSASPDSTIEQFFKKIPRIATNSMGLLEEIDEPLLPQQTP